MKAAKFIFIFGLCLMATTAWAAGFRSIQVPASPDGPALSGAIWYPCNEPPGKIDLGPITIPGTRDCALRSGRLPLVVISHGNLGAYFDHYDTAEALADKGFIVAAISHPGDIVPEGFNPSVMASAMVRRPDDIKRLINFMIAASPVAPNIDPRRIGFFGFSAGAFTGLALIGADPNRSVLCQLASGADVCKRLREGGYPGERVMPDPQIKAAVLADPPGGDFDPAALVAIKTPVQLWASETGGRGLPHIIVTPDGVAAINKDLLEKHEYHVVQNAGHFAFMLCGPSIKAVPIFCADRSGFDRVAFHKQFNKDVVHFFRAQLVRK